MNGVKTLSVDDSDFLTRHVMWPVIVTRSLLTEDVKNINSHKKNIRGIVYMIQRFSDDADC